MFKSELIEIIVLCSLSWRFNPFQLTPIEEKWNCVILSFIYLFTFNFINWLNSKTNFSADVNHCDAFICNIYHSRLSDSARFVCINRYSHIPTEVTVRVCISSHESIECLRLARQHKYLIAINVRITVSNTLKPLRWIKFASLNIRWIFGKRCLYRSVALNENKFDVLFHLSFFQSRFDETWGHFFIFLLCHL